MRDQLVLRVVAKCLIPPILIFGCYIITHGELGPGGGFQGGVVLAAAFIIYALVHGRAALHAAFPRGLWTGLAALGVLLYAGVGLYGTLCGGQFLDYGWLVPGHRSHGEPWGMTLVEYGVGLTVCAVMVLIYDMISEPSEDDVAAELEEAAARKDSA